MYQDSFRDHRIVLRGELGPLQHILADEVDRGTADGDRIIPESALHGLFNSGLIQRCQSKSSSQWH